MHNAFKQALQEGRTLIGMWLGLADALASEMVATAGFDWLLIDGEHAPNDLRTTLAQLQAVAAYGSHPVVRPEQYDAALLKRLLDIGAQTFLVPMIDTAEQAQAVVAATRYPPQGIRGMASALARASRWDAIPDYVQRANEEVCVLVQAETVTALANLQGIVHTDGVDGVFFGAVDLSASMGLLGQPAHPRVHQAILQGIQTVRQAGKAAGLVTTRADLAREYLQAGAQFVAVGVDTLLLVSGARALAAEFGVGPARAASGSQAAGAAPPPGRRS